MLATLAIKLIKLKAEASTPTQSCASAQENSVSGHSWQKSPLWKLDWKTTFKMFLHRRSCTGRFVVTTFQQEAPLVSGIDASSKRRSFNAPTPARKKLAKCMRKPKQTPAERRPLIASERKQQHIMKFLLSGSDQ